MHWRARRKLSYTLIALIPFILIAGVIYYAIFFPDPTCFDGEQNGSETGVDCGGQCERICQSDTSDIAVDWARSFAVSDDIYNAAARMNNPNVTLEANDVQYSFRLFDDEGLLITERRGEMDILPQPDTLAFEAGIEVEDRGVARTEFQFIEKPFWEQSSRTDARFAVSNKTLTDATGTNPRLTFDVSNRTVQNYQGLQLTGVIFDGANKPVHVSRTNLGSIPAQSTKSSAFTWRQPFPTRTVQCTVPSNTMMLLDRSGSMNDKQSDPPQPLTAVKQAASDFIQLLGEPAQSGLVAFAGNSRVRQELTQNHAQTESAIETLQIRPQDESGRTNIGSAVRLARETLDSARNPRSANAMIILTDGRANAPEEPGGEVYARDQIEQVKSAGISVYAIGLGEAVNEQFLADIASEPENYFQAVDRQALSGIYDQIHSDLCQQAPFITEIVPTHYELTQ